LKIAPTLLLRAPFWQLLVLLAAFLAGGHAAAAQQSSIERGEYLARTGDCMACHTAHGPMRLIGRTDIAGM